MPIPHPLPEALVELVAQRFRLIGEPMQSGFGSVPRPLRARIRRSGGGPRAGGGAHRVTSLRRWKTRVSSSDIGQSPART